MTFGEYLRVTRTRAHLSLIALSKLLGKSFGHLSKVEKDERPPLDDYGILLKWARALKVSDVGAFMTWAQIARGTVQVALPEGPLGLVQKYVQIINAVPGWLPSDVERAWKFLSDEGLLENTHDVVLLAEEAATGIPQNRDAVC